MSLVLVANRAPIRQTPQGWAPGLGGLASALLPVLEQRGGAWVAMRPPGEATPAVQRYPEAQPAFTVRRVPLDSAEFEAYYEGMSNRVLWPLAHYLVELVEPERGFREAYRSVNRRFAHAALEAARAEGSDARFWVQDYHLMLAPEMIRLGRPEATVGFFWHIPWPAPEVFRVLPSARALLKGVLGSDLVGFHTEGYAENFREGARDLLGAEIDGESVVWQGRRVRAEAHPIGIDVQHFEALAAADGVADEVAQFRADVGTEQVIVGVDRLDYTKGLLLRLDAFERMLETFPELHGRVSLFQIATPSRTSVPAYARLKQDVDQAVGRINGRFSEGTWTPVQYRYRAYNQTELAFIYASADVALVTPLRDGMNLVAHEFAACSRDGVLVLSELTGAADYLAEPAPAQAGGDQGAVLVNPYDADGLARALRDALAMPEAERRRRLEYVKRAVARLDVHAWADGFLDRLDTVANDSSSTDARDAAVGDAALGAGRAAGSPLRDAPAAPSPTAALLRLPPMPPHPDRPLLFLDYDGTLAPIVDDPAQARPHPTVPDLLADLAATHPVVVVTGRDLTTLATLLPVPVRAVGLHGVETGTLGGDVRSTALDAHAADLARLRDAVPTADGVVVEPKGSGFAVHYRAAPDQDAAVGALRAWANGTPDGLTAIWGKKVVELRPTGVSKGTAVTAIAAEHPDRTPVYLGDDVTDEDAFRALAAWRMPSVTVKVGEGETAAGHRLADPDAVVAYLRGFLA